MSAHKRALEVEASRWLILRQRGFSAVEESEFSSWLRSDRQHAAAFQSVELSWNRLDHLGESRLADEFEAELDELNADTLRKRPLRRSWAALGGVAIACAVMYFAWWRPAQADRSYAETATTRLGQTQLMELPDGSRIQLNTDSAVEVSYSRNARQVILRRGEALFTVAKNPQRPFVVQAAGVDVRAVGTAFNVRLRQEAVDVLVTEGKVSIARDVKAAANSNSTALPATQQARGLELGFLSAGELLTVPTKAAIDQSSDSPGRQTPAAHVVLPPAEIDRLLAWRDRRLVFDGTPLGEIAAEFNRYNDRKLVIADSALAQRRFAGTFQASEPQTFVRLLQASYHLTVQEVGDETRLSLPEN